MPDAPLLKYRTATRPSPLQATGDPDKAPENTVTIAVAAPRGRKVHCKEIQIAVPLQEPAGGGAYFTEPPQSSVGSDKWQSASAAPASGRELGFDDDTNYFHVVFRPKPVPGFDLVDHPLSFTLDGRLAIGDGGPLPLTCLVTETSGSTSGSCEPKDILELDLPVAEPAFRLADFLVEALLTARSDLTVGYYNGERKLTTVGIQGLKVNDLEYDHDI